MARSRHGFAAETLKPIRKAALDAPSCSLQASGSVKLAEALRLGDALSSPLRPSWQTVKPFWPRTSRSAPSLPGVHGLFASPPSLVASVKLGFGPSLTVALRVSGASLALAVAAPPPSSVDGLGRRSVPFAFSPRSTPEELTLREKARLSNASAALSSAGAAPVAGSFAPISQ